MNQDENQPRYCFGDERMVRKPRSSDWSQNDIDRLCALANGTLADVSVKTKEAI